MARKIQGRRTLAAAAAAARAVAVVARGAAVVVVRGAAVAATVARRTAGAITRRTAAGTRWGAAATAVLVALAVAALSPGAYAHVANQKTQFPDIAGDPHAADILLLVALNIVPQTPVFEPEAVFTRRDLAAWAALAHRAAKGGEGPDLAQLVEKGRPYVPSLDGAATAADIDTALFDGRLTKSGAGLRPDMTFTKSEAAHFVAAHLTAADLRRLGYAEGPRGVVEDVKVGTSPDGDPAYMLVIHGRDYAVDEHPRVLGPTDLTLWKGRTVARSLLLTSSEGDAIRFAELAGEGAGAGSEAGVTPSEEAATSSEAASSSEGATASGTTSEAAAASEAAPATAAPAGTSGGVAWGWVAGLGGALVVLGAVLFGRRRA